MRLQLGVAHGIVLGSLLLLCSWSRAYAQGEEEGARGGQATSRTLIYDDDDATTVVTSLVDVDASVADNVSLGAYVVLDSVSSASVDVVSAATGRWTENRVEVGARVSAPVAGSNVLLGFTRSQENDWLSHSLSIGTSRELFRRNTTVSVGYAFTRNKVGRSRDPNFERSLLVHSVELAVGQLLGRLTRGGLAYTFQRTNGYQASPYRFVSSADGVSQAERHPGNRMRHALSGFLLHSLTELLSLRGSYRLYRDDWGIWSHTASMRVELEVSRYLSVALAARYYRQNQADFYRGTYATSARYMTADRELSSFWDVGGGAELASGLGPVQLDVKLSAIRYRFKNFPALPKRLALLVGGGAKVVW